MFRIDALSFDLNLTSHVSFLPKSQNKTKTKTFQPGDDPGSILTIHVDPSIHVRREVGSSSSSKRK